MRAKRTTKTETGGKKRKLRYLSSIRCQKMKSSTATALLCNRHCTCFKKSSSSVCGKWPVDGWIDRPIVGWWLKVAADMRPCRRQVSSPFQATLLQLIDFSINSVSLITAWLEACKRLQYLPLYIHTAPSCSLVSGSVCRGDECDTWVAVTTWL